MKRWTPSSRLALLAVSALALLLAAILAHRPRSSVSPDVASPLPAVFQPLAAAAVPPPPDSLPPHHTRSGPRGLPTLVAFDGPVPTEAAAAIAAAGARVVGAMPPFSLLAEVPDAARPAILAMPGVASLADYPPSRTISPRLLAAAKATPDRTATLRFQTFAPADAPALARHLRALGATDIRTADRTAPARSRWGLVTARLPLATALGMADDPTISWLEEALPERLCNDIARSASNTSADLAQSIGLDGTGEIVAIADTGLDTGDPATLHPDLADRIHAVRDWARDGDWSDLSLHGTHVAGSIAGTGAASTNQYRGMAPAARLVVQSVADAKGVLHIPDEFADLLDDAYALGARIHNDSWGGASAGAYTLRDQQADEYVWAHPDLLIVVAAGNDGEDADGDGTVDPGSLASPAAAKNALTVGAAESGRAPGTGGRTSETYSKRWPTRFPADPIATDLISTPPDGAPPGLAAFSSRGPAADGRAKPDVVAPGTDIVSVRSRAATSTGWGVQGANTNYLFCGGTSMATPITSGGAALVRQWARLRHGIESPSAALLKAALAGGARSLAPGQYGDGPCREIPPRPSSAEGHGLIDLAATLFPGDAAAILLEGPTPLATGATATYPFDVTASAPLTATLGWSDAPAVLGADTALVNDLDLTLLAPDGTEHAPSNAPDRLNNLERIDLPATSVPTGRWQAVVTAWNVPDGPQPWALYLRGPIRTPPAIDHTPLQNQSATAAAYRVSATIAADGGWDPATALLHWSVDGGPEQTALLAADPGTPPALAMLPQTAYIADIPAAPLGSTIAYRITAGETTAPADGGCWTFAVTPDLPLEITAIPEETGTPAPPYGTYLHPSGTVLRATAPATIPDPDDPGGLRTACTGWTGTGSVPPTGDAPETTFTLTAPSVLSWHWQKQAALVETATPAAIAAAVPARTNWWPLGTPAAASSAPAAERLDNPATGETYAFAGWLLDGARWPDGTSPAPLAATDIPMPAPRTLAAQYLPAALDADADGLPDWFTARYFPTASPASLPTADPDGDGWENAAEAADRTDPLDPASLPTPPSIVHTPVATPCGDAFPLRIAAAIADNSAVASATLRIRRNGQPARSIPMAPDPGDPGTWTALTPPVAADGDTFAYSITAADPAGLVAETPEYTIDVRWPALVATPLSGFHPALPAGATASATLTLSNTGSVPLTVTFALVPVGFADDAETGTNGWTARSATTNATTWHLGTAGSHSPANAWCNGLPDYLPVYPCGADDSLSPPPVRLWPADAPRGPAPALSFWHWADLERDYEGEEAADDGLLRMWDTGRLETSTDSGATWFPLDPDGGYPAIQSTTDSAFPGGTPCFAPTGDAWQPVTADLASLAPDAPSASAPVLLRFRFASDAYVVHQGWRIDDIEITPRTRYPSTANWATLSTEALTLAPGETATLAIAFDAASFAPMQTDYQLLDLHHNDPRLPTPLPIPVSLSCTDRQLTVAASGPGTAEPAGTATYPGPTNLLLSFTPGPGAILADLRTNDVTAAAYCGTAVPTTLPVALESNLTVQATFAILPPAGAIPSPDWLAAYGLTNRPPVAEAALDHDRDGLLTWQEADLRSDPLDPADAPLRLRLLPPTGTDTTFRLSWHAYTNTSATYTLLASTNPLAPYLPQQTLPAAPPVMPSPPLPPAPSFHAIHFSP